MSFGKPSVLGGLVDKEEKIKCTLCGWKGRLKECREEYENSIGPLCGREGINWKCPNCDFTVKDWIWKMS